MQFPFSPFVAFIVGVVFVASPVAAQVGIVETAAQSDSILLETSGLAGRNIGVVELEPYQSPDPLGGWAQEGFGGALTPLVGHARLELFDPAPDPFDPFIASPRTIRADYVSHLAMRLRFVDLPGTEDVAFAVFAFDGQGGLWSAGFSVPASADWQIVRFDLAALAGWAGRRTIRIDVAENAHVDPSRYLGAAVELDWIAVTDDPAYAGETPLAYDVFWELGVRTPIWQGTPSGPIELARFAGGRDRLYRRFQLYDMDTPAAIGSPNWVTDVSAVGDRPSEYSDGWQSVNDSATVTFEPDYARVTFRQPDSGPFDPSLFNHNTLIRTTFTQHLSMRCRLTGGTKGMTLTAFSWPYPTGGLGTASTQIANDGRWHIARIDMSTIGAEWSGLRQIRLDPADAEPSAAPFLDAELLIDWIAFTEDPQFDLGDGDGLDFGLRSSRVLWDFRDYGRRSFHFPDAPTKKGLVPWRADDAIELGAKHQAITIFLNPVVDLSGTSPITWDVDGVPVHINMSFVYGFEHDFYKPLTEAGSELYLILVNQLLPGPDPTNPWIHPGTDIENVPTFVMGFNLSDAAGVRNFRAAIEFLAHRYSDPRGQYGRIQHFVIGNELQSHWWWHNIGPTPIDEVAEDYMRNMRVADLALRRTHRDQRAYVSFEHHWSVAFTADPLKSVPGRDLLELFAAQAKAGGDFPWQLAYHPYPSNLLDPRFWNNTDATLDLDTPRITFNNIELLPAVMSQPQFLHDCEMREIVLTEQGLQTLNQADGQAIQAGALAWAFRKVESTPELENLCYFSHVDFEGVGGLQLGLWTQEFAAKKLSWDVYRHADQPDWQTWADPYLPNLPIGSWDDAEPYRTLVRFTFTESLEGWVAANQVSGVGQAYGTLRGTATGGDPFLTRERMSVPPDLVDTIAINLRTGGGASQAALLWQTESEPTFGGDRVLAFPVPGDGVFRLHTLDVGALSSWAGERITALRLDPLENLPGAEFAVDFIAGGQGGCFAIPLTRADEWTHFD